MQAKAKANSVITTSMTEGGLIAFNVLGVGQLTFDRTKASAATKDAAEINGWVQRLSDMAALPRDQKTGASATPQEKYDAIARGIAHYESGTDQWRLNAATGDSGLLFSALCRMSPDRSPEDVRAFMADLDDNTKAQLALDPEVAEVIATIRRERKPADVNTREMLKKAGFLKG